MEACGQNSSLNLEASGGSFPDNKPTTWRFGDNLAIRAPSRWRRSGRRAAAACRAYLQNVATSMKSFCLRYRASQSKFTSKQRPTRASMRWKPLSIGMRQCVASLRFELFCGSQIKDETRLDHNTEVKWKYASMLCCSPKVQKISSVRFSFPSLFSEKCECLFSSFFFVQKSYAEKRCFSIN